MKVGTQTKINMYIDLVPDEDQDVDEDFNVDVWV
jgi:hypothetical protein